MHKMSWWHVVSLQWLEFLDNCTKPWRERATQSVALAYLRPPVSLLQANNSVGTILGVLFSYDSLQVSQSSLMSRMLLRVAAAAAAVAGAIAYGPFYPDSTHDQPFICDYRSFAWEFAKAVQPHHDTRLTFDALMLGSLCNQTRPEGPPPAPAAADAKADCSIYVATTGDDSKSGTSPSEALKTPAAGVAAARKMSGARTVCFGAGTFYLDATLELTSADSDLTLQGDASGGTWFSGAALIAPGLAWTQYKVAPAVPPSLQLLNQTDNQGGCTPNDPTPIAAGGCGCYNQTTTLEACVAKCTALGPKGCPNFAWSGSRGTSDTQSGWDNQCCIHADGVWHPSAQRPHDIPHVSGQWGGGNPAKNIWKTSLPAGTKLPDTPHLRVDGARSTRARHPNANPELDIWPTGWVPDAQTWLPAKPPKSSPQIIQVVNKLLQTRNDGATLTETKNYSGGIGGPCEVFDPPFSYWCSAHPAGGGGFQYYVPSGMQLPDAVFPEGAGTTNWSLGGAGATVHAFRRSHWASWMFDVDGVTEDTIKFGAGGYQGCRGGPGQDWFVENVIELLDFPGEHYIDTKQDPPMLYYAANTTSGPPPSNFDAAVPMLKILLRVNETQANPVKNLVISNVNFRDAAPTYMDPHGVPSGGDWALERLGALFFEGTTGLSVDSCQFERLDGNGIMLSGFHRAAAITNSHFAWTGGSAIAAWGRTDELSDGGVNGWDATKGDIPQGTRVEGNIMRESGIWEKQSSCFFQAKTAGSVLLRNLCFNLPRAGFNFNDGAGGGDQVHGNLIFNSCRETSDHGPINSWDRQPYVTTFGIEGPGVPTAHMVPRNISYNFLVANYGGGNGAVDNDDESLRYDNNHNFQVYGHQKFKTGAIRSFGNVIAYATEFGGKWVTPGTIADEPNAMFDNQVWFVDNAHYHDDKAGEWVGNRSYNNKLVGLNITVGGESLKQWQAADPATNDVGSTYTNTPISTQAAEVIAAARALLSPVMESN
eukprot:m.430160 g.430160  ORF g.430160 m.430160 type:complete len:990 (+) comp17121_c0_seq1:2833-5802(+)